MSGIIGGRNHRGSGLIADLGTDGQVFTSAGAGLRQVFEAAAAGGASTHLLYSEFAMDNATGTDLTISGVGFTPKLVIMYWVIANGAAVTLGLFGDPSLEEDSIEQREAGTDKWQITQNKMILRYTAGGDRQEFVLSAIGSDGFTLANTLAGSSPSGTSEILFACIG